jgi:peroxiredoxin
MGRRLGPWLIGGALLVAALFAVVTGGRVSAPVARGSNAPAFELPQLDAPAEAPALALSDLRGRVVLLNFWATWCLPCEAEMPAMERLYRRFQGSGFALVAVSVDEDPDAVREFRDRLGLSFPILLDPERRVSDAYQTFRFPETLLVGPDGVVVERYVGEKDWDAAAYVDRIRRLLATGLPSGPA